MNEKKLYVYETRVFVLIIMVDKMMMIKTEKMKGNELLTRSFFGSFVLFGLLLLAIVKKKPIRHAHTHSARVGIFSFFFYILLFDLDLCHRRIVVVIVAAGQLF